VTVAMAAIRAASSILGTRAASARDRPQELCNELCNELRNERRKAHPYPARFAWFVVTAGLMPACGEPRVGNRRQNRNAGLLAGACQKMGGGGLLPVLLDARGAQAGEAVLVDRVLPGEEFFDRQRIAAAGLLEGQKSAAHGSDDLGLAPDDPTLRTRCGQVGDRQRAAVRPDNILCPWSKGLRHKVTHTLD
jgi:hypothetical protein